MCNFRENFGKESVLTALVPKKPVALPVGRINIDQRAVENASMEDKNSNSTYKVDDNINEKVTLCEQVESSASSSIIEDTDEKYMSSEVSSCEEVESDAPSSAIDDTEGGSESLGVSSREQVQTPSMVYSTEGRISSEGLNNLYDGIRNLKSKGSDLDSL